MLNLYTRLPEVTNAQHRIIENTSPSRRFLRLSAPPDDNHFQYGELLLTIHSI
jgi:hypothetical protein